jgi:hypothetical protein
VYREYREGELPDIAGLTGKDFTRPAAATVLDDTQVAVTFVVAFFEQVYVAVKEHIRKEFRERLRWLFEKVGSQGLGGDQLASMLLKMTHFVVTTDRLSFLPPSLISLVGIKTSQVYGAVRLLEEHLLLSSAGAEGTAISAHWTELYRLFSALGEKDMLIGVASRLETANAKNYSSRQAIDAELRWVSLQTRPLVCVFNSFLPSVAGTTL